MHADGRCGITVDRATSSVTSLNHSSPVPSVPTAFPRRLGSLLFDVYGHVFSRRQDGRFYPHRDHGGGSLRRLVGSAEVGRRFRRTGNKTGSSVFESFPGAVAPFRTIAVNGEQNATVPDSAGVLEDK